MEVPTDQMILAGREAKQRRVHFDPTINLGHILTFIGFLLAGGGLYIELKSHLTAHEIRINAIEKTSDGDKAELREAVKAVREDLRELRRSIDDLRNAQIPANSRPTSERRP